VAPAEVEPLKLPSGDKVPQRVKLFDALTCETQFDADELITALPSLSTMTPLVFKMTVHVP
jgi:hypothetical protein